MATSQGTVKKTPLSAFSRPRASGIIAVDLRDDDRLTGVSLTDGSREIMLFSSGGKAIRFHEEEVRPMGRDSTGVRGIKLGDDQTVIALIVVGEGHVLVASEQRLRQAHAARRLPVARPRRSGRHRAADHRSQRFDHRRAAGAASTRS